MKNFTYKGYTVTVFESYNGRQIFINDADGVSVWAHKFTGDALKQAKRIINAN